MLGLIGKFVAVGVILAGIVGAALYLAKGREGAVAEGPGVPGKEETIDAAVKRDQLKVIENVKQFLDRDRGEELLSEEAEAPDPMVEQGELAQGDDDSTQEEAVDLHKYLAEEPESFEKEVTNFEESDLEQEVMWRVIGDWVYFRVSFSPFDAGTHELMQRKEEGISLSFLDGRGESVVPASGPALVLMSSLYQRHEGGEIRGWGFNGKLFLGEIKGGDLDSSRVDMHLSPVLFEHLKRLKQMRSADSESVQSGVSSR